MIPIGTAGKVSQFGMRRHFKSVSAATAVTRLSVTRMGKGVIRISPGKQGSRSVRIQPLPSERLERRDEGIIVWQQGVRETELVELRTPAGTKLGQPTILLQKFSAVQIATAVEEHLSRSRKTINKVSAKLVGRENARIGGQLLHFGACGPRKLGRRKTPAA